MKTSCYLQDTRICTFFLKSKNLFCDEEVPRSLFIYLKNLKRKTEGIFQYLNIKDFNKILAITLWQNGDDLLLMKEESLAIKFETLANSYCKNGLSSD